MKDGGVRLIHNLKNLNSFVENSHFKTESVHTVLNLVTPNCSMTSLDFKDACYSVKVHPDFQKLFKFIHDKYTALPNGLCTCPRKFTETMEPPLAILRRQCASPTMVFLKYTGDYVTLTSVLTPSAAPCRCNFVFRCLPSLAGLGCKF